MSSRPARDSRNQVRKILDILQRHGEVLSDALEGSVELGDKAYTASIDALVDINALMPVEEGQFQLNPRLRIFLSEQLAKYSAFQTLTRISEQIHGVKAKWREILDIKESGNLRDMPALEESLVHTVNEIVHYTTHNLLLLNTQIASDYGNVKTLKSKLRQNAFYQSGVKTLLQELKQLDVFTEEVAREALGRGMHLVRQLVNARIRSRLPDWMTKLNDIQATITKRLFIARTLDKEVLHLSKAVLWMTRNPTRDGFELEVPESADVALMRPTVIKVRPQVDVSDVQLHNQEMLYRSVRRMPVPLDPWRPRQENEPQYVIERGQQEVEEVLPPEDELIQEIIEQLRAEGAKPISLGLWTQAHPLPPGIDMEAWFLYSANQLSLAGMLIHFTVMTERSAGLLNDVFDDVIVTPRRAAIHA